MRDNYKVSPTRFSAHGQAAAAAVHREYEVRRPVAGVGDPVKMGLKVRKLRDLRHFTHSATFCAFCYISRDLRFSRRVDSSLMSLEQAGPYGKAAPWWILGN